MTKRLEIKLTSERVPTWVLVALAAVCWVMSFEYRLELEHTKEGAA